MHTENFFLIDDDDNYYFQGYGACPAHHENDFLCARGYKTAAGARTAMKRRGLENVTIKTREEMTRNNDERP